MGRKPRKRVTSFWDGQAAPSAQRFAWRHELGGSTADRGRRIRALSQAKASVFDRSARPHRPAATLAHSGLQKARDPEGSRSLLHPILVDVARSNAVDRSHIQRRLTAPEWS